MLLEDFIKASGIKKKSFANSVGISTTSLWKILKGMVNPSLKTAHRIEEFTRGKVSIGELILGKLPKDLEVRPSLNERILKLEEKVAYLEKKLEFGRKKILGANEIDQQN